MAGAYHACPGTRAGPRRDMSCSGRHMSKARIVATVIAFALAGLLVYRFARPQAEPVLVNLTPGPPQPRVSPQEAGIDLVALDQAAEFAARHHTRALLVGHGGHVAFEKYWGGTTAETTVETGFAPVLLGLAVGAAM